jgi:glycosyltransferase involved in cell wall biosynthesis
MYKQHKIGVVVPAYNVEGFIKNTIEGLPALVDRIYVIDDGSPDNTANIVKALSNSNVYLIQHERNKGPGAAMSTGCKAALEDEMDVIVKLDGDGQMPSEYMENLIMPIIERKASYTKGDRLSNPDYRGKMPRSRLFGNILLTGLTRIASGYWHINDTQNGFVAISRRALESIDVETIYPHYGYLNDILVRLNVSAFEVQDVPMPAKYGSEKSSIKYRGYIPHVSFVLLRRFLWRLWGKYIRA